MIKEDYNFNKIINQINKHTQRRSKYQQQFLHTPLKQMNRSKLQKKKKMNTNQVLISYERFRNDNRESDQNYLARYCGSRES